MTWYACARLEDTVLATYACHVWQTAVSTALPTVVERLHGSDFIWAGGAYTIASTAILPLVGGLVEGFGRKNVLLFFVFVFTMGSVLCGSAVSMRMLIIGRGRSRRRLISISLALR